MRNQFISDLQSALKNPKWQVDNALSRASIPAELAPWLCNKGSLTSALMNIADGSFKVEVLQQTFTKPLWHEQQKLARQDNLVAMVREVYLHIQGEPVVYARSIIPQSLARRGGGGLATLGKIPLGHLLFKSGHMRVSRREFSCVGIDGSAVFARRTPYEYLGDTILVSEFFLPSFKKYL